MDHRISLGALIDNVDIVSIGGPQSYDWHIVQSLGDQMGQVSMAF